MARGRVIVQADGARGEAEGDVVRLSQGACVGRAIAFAGGGLVLGAISILVPILHLISTWALPLIGFVLAALTLKNPLRIKNVRGGCPSCEAELELPGGSGRESVSEYCSGCGAQFRLTPAESA